MNDRKAANAARVQAATVGLAVAAVVGTGALAGLAWAQDNADKSTTVDDVISNRTGSTSSDDSDTNSHSGSTTTWPQLSTGSSSSSHTRSSGS